MRLFTVLSLVLFCSQGFSQILVDETWGAGAKATNKTTASFGDVTSLRKTRKLGVEGTIMGATGLLGVNLEINLAPDFALSMGPGVGRGYHTFNMHVKKFFGGSSLSPYIVGGYSRWIGRGSTDGLQDSSPGFLSERFLTRRERQTGEFAKDIIYPGLGLQFLNTSGDWAGVGFFAEILFMVDIEDVETSPTAGAGSVFYF